MSRAPLHSRVAVLGASPKPDRYSYKAMVLLAEHGFAPIPVHPARHAVNGVTGVKSLSDITEKIDTLTMYVGESISNGEHDRILALHPRRVIFNPGSENVALAEKLAKAGIEVVEACTLVMLSSEQF